MNSKKLDGKIKEIEETISKDDKFSQLSANDQIKQLNSVLDTYTSEDIKKMSDDELVKELTVECTKIGITLEELDNMSFEELDKLIEKKYNS